MNEKQNQRNNSPEDPREWLVRARSNLNLAKTQSEDVLLEDLCFEAQQSVEKAVKALLIFYDMDYPYTHDLADLLSSLKENIDANIPDTVEQIPRLTRYAVAARYPGPSGTVTEEDYDRALKIAKETLEWASQLIEKSKST